MGPYFLKLEYVFYGNRFGVLDYPARIGTFAISIIYFLSTTNNFERKRCFSTGIVNRLQTNHLPILCNNQRIACDKIDVRRLCAVALHTFLRSFVFAPEYFTQAGRTIAVEIGSYYVGYEACCLRG